MNTPRKISDILPSTCQKLLKSVEICLSLTKTNLLIFLRLGVQTCHNCFTEVVFLVHVMRLIDITRLLRLWLTFWDLFYLGPILFLRSHAIMPASHDGVLSTKFRLSFSLVFDCHSSKDDHSY